MDLIADMRVHKAVYWAPAGVDRFQRRTYADPVEIDCRWTDKIMKYTDRLGQEKVSRSVVYPDRELSVVGGVLWRGELADLTDTANPFNNTGAYEISYFGKTDTIDGDDTLYKAIL